MSKSELKEKMGRNENNFASSFELFVKLSIFGE